MEKPWPHHRASAARPPAPHTPAMWRGSPWALLPRSCYHVLLHPHCLQLHTAECATGSPGCNCPPRGCPAAGGGGMPSDTAAHVARGLEGSHTRPGGVVLPGGECTAHHGRPDMGGDTVTESCWWRLSARALWEEARGDPRNPTPAVRPRPTLRPSSPRKPQVATRPDDKVTIWGARTIPCAGRSPPEALPSWGHFCWGGQARTRALHAVTFTWREKRQQPACVQLKG